MNSKKLILPVMAALLFSTSLAQAETKTDTAPPSAPAVHAESDSATKTSGKKRGPLANMDSNHDGSVDLGEAEAFADAQFKKMDTDNDGFVTFAEMEALHKARREEWAAKRAARSEKAGDEAAADKSDAADKGDKKRAPLSEEARAHMKAKAAERKEKQQALLDKDGDGKVTRAEFVAQALERHKKLDLDGDTKITKEEIQKSHQQRRDSRKAAKDAGEGKAPAADKTEVQPAE